MNDEDEDRDAPMRRASLARVKRSQSLSASIMNGVVVLPTSL